jgi:hypothetical protein
MGVSISRLVFKGNPTGLLRFAYGNSFLQGKGRVCGAEKTGF